MNLYKATLTIYEELFRQSSLNTSFVCRLDSRQRKTLFKFLFWFKDKYPPQERTVNLLVQYFEFQFSRYAGGYSNNHGKNKIMLNWLVGQKAINEWEGRNVGRRWFVRIKMKEEVGLRLNKVFRNERSEAAIKKTLKAFLPVDRFEEEAKQKYFNQDGGYLFCDLTTTLYHPLSEWCNKCNSKDVCIERLKRIYPKLYNSRIDG